MKWNKFVEKNFASGNRPAFFDNLLENSSREVKPPVGAPAKIENSELLSLLQKTLASDRKNVLMAFLERELKVMLHLTPETTIDSEKGFMELGLDSLMSIDFRNKLKVAVGPTLGAKLPVTLVMNYPNLKALSEFLLRDVLPIESAAAKPVAQTPKKKVIANEPIAIVGAACRMPGSSNSLEAFWEFLKEGRDGMVEIPESRWDIEEYYSADPDEPGKITTRKMGFIDDVDKFDANFFGIFPLEASEIDPSQRLFLEVAWEALESAGEIPENLRGSRTGVYAGVATYDYQSLHIKNKSGEMSSFFGIGTLPPAVAGRVSYYFGFQGPSFIVDTACSSALVAIHNACASLRIHEIDRALAGGVNLILSPEISISFTKAKMLAPDGTCKSFDESADGYARAEGVGIVVLKRLSDAISNNDQILGVIRSSSCNQDGRSSTLTAPNGPAQEALIRESLEKGGIAPSDVSYYEAHGTGTPLGDPIEVNAFGAVLKEGRTPENPLTIGSHKSNMGHAEGAAGIAGVLKVVASLMHKQIPPNLHFKKLNPKISLDEIPARVATSLMNWDIRGKSRIAGVSAFGFTGTNANVMLEEAPVSKKSSEKNSLERPLHILCLSAKSAPALKDNLDRYTKFLKGKNDLSIENVVYTANACRTHFEKRVFVTASSKVELIDNLQAKLSSIDAATKQPTPAIGAPKVGLLFSSQGSQYVGMGSELYRTQPTFKKSLDECARILEKYLEKPLVKVMFGEDGLGELLDETRYTQPALFALEYSLFQMWKSWGIEPQAVMGHSVGELVAACVAGLFSLEDGLKLIAKRGELMQKLPGKGGMAAVRASEEKVKEYIKSDRVSIAAVNGPMMVTISGYDEDMIQILGQMETDEIAFAKLEVSHAFHSSQMDAMLKEFEQVVSEVKFNELQMKLVSNITGKMAEFADISRPSYWSRQLREAVRFSDGIQTMQEAGCRYFVEIGPGNTLVGMGRACIEGENTKWLPSLRKAKKDWEQILETVGALYVDGLKINWQGFEADYPARQKVQLPTYPFQHKRFWIDVKKFPSKSHIQAVK